MNPSFNMSSVFNGISKALTVANQAIPLYKQVSPMIKNARTVYSTIKDLSSKKTFNPKNNSQNNNTNYSNNNINTKKEVVYNNPIFFQ